jgi:carboxyl-terminal processing protease
MTKNQTNAASPDSKQRAAIVEAIKQRVRKSYVNVGGVDLDAWARDFDDRIAGSLAGEIEEFEEHVREHLKALKSSHTAFYHGLQNRLLPQHTINATLKSVGSNGSQRWMFLDVFPEGPAQKAGIRPGQILDAVDGAPAIPPNLPSLKTGQDYKLVISDLAGGDSREIALSVPFQKGTKQRPPIVEPKAVTLEILSSRIGVLRIPYFSGAAGLRFGASLASAVSDLRKAGADRLIIDLRGNIGGSLGFSMLASYMCADQEPIGYSVTPQSVRHGYERDKLARVPMPRTKLSLLMTLAEFAFRDKSVVLMTQGLGPQPFHGRIAVLINEWTNSAGEMAASFARENAFATVVGTKTAGNVLGAQNFNVGGGYYVRIPVFGWSAWKAGCLDGIGVEPDLTVEQDPLSLSSNEDVQFNRAIQIVSM